MTTLARRIPTLSAGADIAIGAITISSPTSRAAVDPSAYGIWATGPITNLAPTPAVDWTGGAGLAASSISAHAPGLSAGPAHVASGSGYAEADQADLRYGAIEIRSVTATCHEGDTSVRIYGTDGSLALAAGRSVQFGGTRMSVGVVTHFGDGSTSVSGAMITGHGEQITVAVARCGAAS